MPDVSVEIKGLEQLERKIGGLRTLKTVRAALKAGALHVKGKAEDYPPATIANSPGNPKGRWYERGQGPRWRRKDGTIGGRDTSETLGRSWTIKEKDGGMAQSVADTKPKGGIGAFVSYGPYVQGPQEQARALKRIGWKTTDEIARQEEATVMRFIQEHINRELAKP